MATQEAKTTRKRSAGKSATGTKRRSTKSAASQAKSPRTRKSTRNTSTRVRKQINVNKPLATSDTQDENRVAPPKYRKGSMRIVPLGGLGEIGRNMNVIEYNGHILLIDCGVLFPEEEQPGVDLILPDFNYIKDRLDKVDALVLTHGHEDHIGGVPYLLKMRPDIPLIGSKLTLGFVEAKCREHRIEPVMTQVEGRDKLKVGPFNLEFVSVTHSIPDALAVCVRTPAGSLIDTGDIKLDQLPLDHRVTDLVEFGKLGEQGIEAGDLDRPGTRPGVRHRDAQDHRRQLLEPRAPRAAGGGRRPQVWPQSRVRRPFDGAQHGHRRRSGLPAPA